MYSVTSKDFIHSVTNGTRSPLLTEPRNLNYTQPNSLNVPPHKAISQLLYNT